MNEQWTSTSVESDSACARHKPVDSRLRLSATERRVEIARAAARVIIAHGMPALRVYQVADEAGVSQPLVSQHYRSRDELIAAAFVVSDQVAYETIVERSLQATTGHGRIVAFIAGCLDGNREIADSWTLWHQAWAYSSFSPRLDKLIRERQRTWIGHCEQLIRVGREDGSIPARADPEDAAMLLMIMLDGAGLSLRYGLIDQEGARRLALSVVETTLGRSTEVGSS